MHTKKIQFNNGFTLIELLVTIMVIAIITSISVGTVVNMRERSASQMAQDIVDLLKLGSDEAAITGTIIGLFYNDNDNILLLRSYARPTKELDQSAVGAFGNIIDVISGGENIQETTNQLAFEDPGDFPDIDMPIWIEKPIHTLAFSSSIALDIEISKANTVNNRLARAMQQIRQNIQNAVADQSNDQKDIEAIIRFFPDGSVVPAGQIAVATNDDRITVAWENNGKNTITK